ncbi:hypothetical protein Gasu2_13860 [Galdieria sulphuraria]|uniref:Mediator of RNA polymerase II transcription subunit 21 n=1 Tax=Galdieria sulphuraria TaxID=130081 RepID=M2XST3_GALSU|nr:uncharacterized protein Gasu_56270 [Galdieria sulphuraria]EME26728.1 hypothetical protein Gasu_56270 [Galdieria sulphuraria]GJD07002.1 hypothetical protein Gasu2_13860 [Galdieria sulphuraria]|eukprot:XP_005703248.1 hypothetical protein Gasu_56270 [Galdieria sulphuraria]
MNDTISELHREIRQLSVAMFTGIGVTQRDAVMTEATTPRSLAEAGSCQESTTLQDKESFRESVTQLATDITNKTQQILQTLEQVECLEEEAKLLEDSLLTQERDREATKRMTEEWEYTFQLYEVLKSLEKFSTEGH